MQTGWTLYGQGLKDENLVVASIFSGVTQLVFMVIVLLFNKDFGRMVVIAGTIVGHYYGLLLLDNEQIGWVSFVEQISLTFVNLYFLALSIYYWDGTGYVPSGQLVMCFNSSIWAYYAYTINSKQILIPSLADLGIFISTVFVGLFAPVKSNTKVAPVENSSAKKQKKKKRD